MTGDGQNLALDAGTGGAVTTASVSGVDVLTLTNAASFTFSGPVTATTLTASNEPYTVTFEGGGTITNSVLFFKTGTVTLGTNPSDVLTFLGGLRATIPAVIIDGKVPNRRTADCPGQRYVTRRRHAGYHGQWGRCGRCGHQPGNGDR